MIKKGRTKIKLAAFLSSLIILFALIEVIAVTPATTQIKEIVLVEIDGFENLNRLEQAGAEVLEVYDRYAVVRLENGIINDMTADMGINRLPGRTTLYAGGERFDFTIGEPSIPDELRVDGYEPGTKGQYIVHMLGPIASHWRTTLEDMGVQVLNYVSNHAYRIRMTQESAMEVEELYFVDWVGIYHPYYKLQPGIATGIVEIGLVPGALEEDVQQVRDNVVVLSEIEAGDGRFLFVALTDSNFDLHELARIKDVDYIIQHVESELQDEMATQIVDGGLWFFDDEDGDPDTAYRLHGNFGSYMNQIGYTGDGVVVAVADTGIGNGTIGDAGHPDFTRRVIGGYSYQGGWEDGHSHGTHCTGSVGADTYHGNNVTIYKDYLAAQGSAPNSEFFAVRIFDASGSWIGPMDYYNIVEVAAKNSHAYVHTNSWGASTGGAYNARSYGYDVAVRDADTDTPLNQPMVITVSAGNSGPDDNTIGSPATAKNVITVGGSKNYNPDEGLSDPETMYRYSSRGWALDNRVKPDVIAPAQLVYSTMPDGWYDYKSGTSMSNPAVAGSAAVIIEWYEDIYGYRPSPAMVKAILINTANQIDGNTRGAIPNQDEGWGMVDISKLARPLADPVPFFVEDQTLVFTDSLQTETHSLTIDREDVPLKISLVWTDQEAPPGTGGGRTLINDLNIEVESPSGAIYRGNAFNGSWTESDVDTMSDFDNSGDGWDDTNNVENVYIHPDDVELGTYNVSVISREIAADSVNLGLNSQDYALVAYNAVSPSGEPPQVNVDSPQPGETWYAHDHEYINWTTSEGDDPIDHVSLAYSIDNGTIWSSIVNKIDDIGSYLWEIPNVDSDFCRVRIRVFDTSGRAGENVSDDTFKIKGVIPNPPENLSVEHIGLDNREWHYLYDAEHRPDSYSSVGFSGIWYGGIRIELPAGEITKIAYLDFDSANHVKGMIYSDGGDEPDTLIGETETVTELGYRRWIEIDMIDNINVHGGYYWIVMEINDNGDGYRPFGTIEPYVNDGGYYFDGESWVPLLDYGLDSSWGLEVIVKEFDEKSYDDNLMTWSSSPDEENDVISHYNIYRSQEHTGPWDDTTFIYGKTADKSSSYTYYDLEKGMADDVYWWYVIRAVGTNGVEEENTIAVQEPELIFETFEIPLYSREESNSWNFVSFNLNLLNISLTGILDNASHGIQGNYDSVMYYNSRDDEWQSYVPGRAEHFNGLDTWNRHMGIWIRMTLNDTLIVEGPTPKSTDITLHPGWNMVGLPSSTTGNHGLPAEVSRIGYFSATATYNIAYDYDPANFEFSPGQGYMVYLDHTESVVWTVDY